MRRKISGGSKRSHAERKRREKAMAENGAGSGLLSRLKAERAELDIPICNLERRGVR